MICNNSESTVNNNGNYGGYLKLERVVRQSCLLSGYLFTLAIETLSNLILYDENIKRIKIYNKKSK